MKNITNLKDLTKFTDKIRSQKGYRDPIAWAIGRVNKGMRCDKVLSVNYAVVNHKESYGCAAIILNALSESGIKVNFNDSEFVTPLALKPTKKALKALKFLKDEAIGDAHRNLQTLMIVKEVLEQDKNVKKELKMVDGPNDYEFVVTFIYENEQPKSIESVYLKLYLLSLGKVALRSLNLNNAFSVLPNVAWDDNLRPIELDWLRENEIWLKMYSSYPTIVSVDKFPRYLSHVIPADNVRILDDAKVRMGAYLADGTTVMPGASYVNFNAGTTGSVMIEGRVSSSVIVGEGSDVGGGASILGVLSGTNGNPVSIGKRCLLGANSVTGIPLGDDCIVDGGIAVLEGTKIFISEKDREGLVKINSDFIFEKEIYKASELAKLNGLHFRQNSQTGQMVATISKRAIKLNADLH